MTPISAAAKEALVAKGKNVIAIHCHQRLELAVDLLFDIAKVLIL